MVLRWKQKWYGDGVKNTSHDWEIPSLPKTVQYINLLEKQIKEIVLISVNRNSIWNYPKLVIIEKSYNKLRTGWRVNWKTSYHKSMACNRNLWRPNRLISKLSREKRQNPAHFLNLRLSALKCWEDRTFLLEKHNLSVSRAVLNSALTQRLKLYAIHSYFSKQNGVLFS